MANMAAVTHEIDDGFWAALGGEGAIVLPEPVEVGEGVLFQLSDADGSLGMSEVGRGDLTLGMLDTSDVFLCDTGPALLIWIGGDASPKESAAAMDTATKYLKQMQKPLTTQVTVLKEGFTASCPTFQEVFAY